MSVFMSKLTKLFTLNMCSLLYVNYALYNAVKNIIWLHSRPTETETIGMRPRTPLPNKHSRWFCCTIKSETTDLGDKLPADGWNKALDRGTDLRVICLEVIAEVIAWGDERKEQKARGGTRENPPQETKKKRSSWQKKQGRRVGGSGKEGQMPKKEILRYEVINNADTNVVFA